jgi:hypothetical protein
MDAAIGRCCASAWSFRKAGELVNFLVVVGAVDPEAAELTSDRLFVFSGSRDDDGKLRRRSTGYVVSLVNFDLFHRHPANRQQRQRHA